MHHKPHALTWTTQGIRAAQLHLQTARHSRRMDEFASTTGGSAAGRSSPRKQQQQQQRRRAAVTPAQKELAAASASPLLSMRGAHPLDFSSLLHGEYHSAGIGVRQAMQPHWQQRSAMPAA